MCAIVAQIVRDGGGAVRLSLKDPVQNINSQKGARFWLPQS